MSEDGTIRIAFEVGGTCRLTRLRVAAGAFWLGGTGDGKSRLEDGRQRSLLGLEFSPRGDGATREAWLMQGYDRSPGGQKGGWDGLPRTRNGLSEISFDG